MNASAAAYGYGAYYERQRNIGMIQPAQGMTSCPRCGSRIPVDARFCGSCGTHMTSAPHAATAVQQSSRAPYGGGMNAEIAAPSRGYASAAYAPGYGQAAAPASVMGASRSSSAFTVAGIIARVVAALTAIAMLLPWLGVPALSTLGEWGSYLGLPTSGDYSYTIYGLGELFDYLNGFVSLGDFYTVYLLFMGVWGLAIGALVVGMVFSFMGKKSARALLPGGIAAVVVALIWFLGVTYLDGEMSSQVAQYLGFSIQFFEVTPAVFATVITGIATAILGILDRPAA